MRTNMEWHEKILISRNWRAVLAYLNYFIHVQRYIYLHIYMCIAMHRSEMPYSLAFAAYAALFAIYINLHETVDERKYIYVCVDEIRPCVELLGGCGSDHRRLPRYGRRRRHRRHSTQFDQPSTYTAFFRVFSQKKKAKSIYVSMNIVCSYAKKKQHTRRYNVNVGFVL